MHGQKSHMYNRVVRCMYAGDARSVKDAYAYAMALLTLLKPTPTQLTTTSPGLGVDSSEAFGAWTLNRTPKKVIKSRRYCILWISGGSERMSLPTHECAVRSPIRHRPTSSLPSTINSMTSHWCLLSTHPPL